MNKSEPIYKLLFLVAGLPFIALLLLSGCAQDNVFADGDGQIRIDSISPSSGVAGTKVRIFGNGFSATKQDNNVTVNGAEVPIDTSSLSTILVTVSQNASTGPVEVRVGSRTAEGPVFTLVAPPVFAGIQPTQGIAGTLVTISGTGFDLVTSVLFNGVATPITQRSSTQLQVAAPSSTTGNVTLAYNGGNITGPVFTYLPIPLIQEVEIVTLRQSYLLIRGINFKQDPATLIVLINGVNTAIAGQQLDPEPSQLAVLAPGPATQNPVEIIVEMTGIKSPPYTFTIQPNLATFAYQQTGSSGNNLTFSFTITGGYFGNAGGHTSVEIRNPTTNVVTTATIQSWNPELITGSFTVDPTSLGPNDLYVVTVVVNGIRSNEEYFRP